MRQLAFLVAVCAECNVSVNRYLFMIIRKPGTVVTLNWQYYYQNEREALQRSQHLIIKSITTLRDKMFVLRDLGPEQEDDQPGLAWTSINGRECKDNK